MLMTDKSFSNEDISFEIKSPLKCILLLFLSIKKYSFLNSFLSLSKVLPVAETHCVRNSKIIYQILTQMLLLR